MFLSTNRVEQLANKLVKEGRSDQLESELRRFNPNQVSTEELEAWLHLRGIAAFQRGDHPTALERFQEANRKFPQSATIAFSLGQEFEFAGRIQAAFELFDRFPFPAIPASHALAQARFAYLWSDIPRSLRYTLPIVDAYRELVIVDDTFLYMRHLPFFSVTWSCLGCFYSLTGDLGAFQDLTEDLAKTLKEYDFTTLLTFLSAVVSNDFSAYVLQLRSSLRQYETQGTPGGLPAMKSTVLEIGGMNDSIQAQGMLDQVTLTDQDFPWLQDIRLLASIALQSERGRRPLPKEMVAEFLRRQPLLFEPNHAFDFQLISTQEAIKQEYQDARLRHGSPAA
jgi:tetratricopeptide (TPR) repeat protein